MEVTEGMLRVLGKEAMQEVVGTDEILNNPTWQKTHTSVLSARIAQRVMVKLWSQFIPIEGQLSRIVVKVPVKGDTRLVNFWRVLVRPDDAPMLDVNPLQYELFPWTVGSTMNFRPAEFLLDIERWESMREVGIKA